MPDGLGSYASSKRGRIRPLSEVTDSLDHPDATPGSKSVSPLAHGDSFSNHMMGPGNLYFA